MDPCFISCDYSAQKFFFFFLVHTASGAAAARKMMWSRSNFDHVTAVVPTLSMHAQKAVWQTQKGVMAKVQIIFDLPMYKLSSRSTSYVFVYTFFYYPSQHNNYQDLIHVTSVKWVYWWYNFAICSSSYSQPQAIPIHNNFSDFWIALNANIYYNVMIICSTLQVTQYVVFSNLLLFHPSTVPIFSSSQCSQIPWVYFLPLM
jgi:hypothetical protein